MRIYKRCKLVHIVCDECGKKFKVGFDKYGLPNGVCFEMVDGSKIDVCAACIEKYGKDKEGK